MITSAVLSECGRYRYLLSREWDGAGRVAFLMLNPSTADATKDDATIRKCVSLARGWGFGALDVVNLFAWRSTAPEGLLGVMDPVGPDNDHHTVQTIDGASLVVLAWGRHVPVAELIARRAFVVRRLLRETKGSAPIATLGKNGDGSPKHPLYLKATTPWLPEG